MRTQLSALTLACGIVTFAGPALADTFTFEHGASAEDPALNFETDCLGASEGDDCAARAALLSAELVEVLTDLEDESDSETVALFQSVTEMADPRVQEVALRYFARHSNPPSDLWSRVREFFFGPEPSVGQAAAELLKNSTQQDDRDLATRYLKGRPSEGYAGNFPRGVGLNDSWALAAGKDAVLERLDAFDPDERFSNATRSLVLDSFVGDPLSGDYMAEVAVTGFVTDAPRSEVEQHFTKLFGAKPYPSLEAARERMTELQQELYKLQAQLLGGDLSAANRLTALSDELQTAQLAVSAGERLNLEKMQCTDHAYWLSGKAADLFSGKLPRAVALGPDELLDGTAIRYYGGERRGPSEGAGLGQDDSGDESDSGDSDGDDNGDGHGPKAKADGGCSLAVGNRTSGPAPWLLLLVAALGLRRASRSLRRG